MKFMEKKLYYKNDNWIISIKLDNPIINVYDDSLSTLIKWVIFEIRDFIFHK